MFYYILSINGVILFWKELKRSNNTHYLYSKRMHNAFYKYSYNLRRCEIKCDCHKKYATRHTYIQ